MQITRPWQSIRSLHASSYGCRSAGKGGGADESNARSIFSIEKGMEKRAVLATRSYSFDDIRYEDVRRVAR